MKRIQVFYSGRVQGIGFRFTAERIARSQGITGWVKNLRDGRVQIVAEAEEDKLKKFLKEIDSYFSGYIKDKAEDWQEATGEFKEFGIGF